MTDQSVKIQEEQIVPPRTADKATRKDQILTAAANAFARKGYQETTVDEIAREAGIAKGSVYLAYKSKEDLFYGLFDEFSRDFIVDEFDAAQISTEHTCDQLFETLCRITEAIENDKVLIPLTLEFWSVCGAEQTKDRFGQRYAEALDLFQTRIIALLKQGQTRKEILPEAPLREVASCLIATLDGLIIQQWTKPQISSSKTLKKALPILLNSLRI